ncbi:MAG TPA: hypothetical protein VK590_14385 [Saprospiraceae bacterium]|nr:hypothetical protein [Saprospiraceae bacterium]
MSHSEQDENVGKKSMCLMYLIFFLLLLLIGIVIVVERGSAISW